MTDGGAALVHVDGTLPIGIQHTREKLALDGVAVSFDFSATPIKAVKLSVTSDTAHTAEMVAGLAYCIDPPNSAIRDAWLTEGTNLTGDTNRFLLKVGGDEVIEFKDINGDDYGVNYIGIKLDDGAGTLRVVAAGVEL